ncbi:DNA replication/repair protein RecF [Psychrobacter sp. I-STPA6b]|uniref:DNA replication/repair protein RecF n=1 Tax=Psychrobacter sp. I-STPA6b TaxID=2585718 RepID=UPI001D0BF68D|nr:DNA replication and repair protein RecF [Psychrobacter sp. I-STPA6b]
MITRLTISHLRNLQQVSLSAQQCNLIIGDNGSGKTSLLEGIFLLSRGKSFRHHQPKRYISHHQLATTVHAQFADDDSMAIQKQLDASTTLRLNQQTVYTQSSLTQRLPTLLIDPSSMDMLEDGSASRRQLLDWLAFHVKQGFHSQWLAYQRLLKQRNTLLKSSHHLTAMQRQELMAWDKGLANHAGLITHYRQQVFEQWQPYFNDILQSLLPQYAEDIKLSFYAGYDVDTPLDELLAQRLSQDVQMGYTRLGCHRADIQVTWLSEREQLKTQDLPENSANSHSNDIDINVSHETSNKAVNSHSHIKEQAVNVLSRGEKKLLITTLRLSQLPLLNHNVLQQAEAKIPIVLLDDVTAELDDKALAVLFSTLATTPCQLFITSLDETVLDLVKQFWQDFAVFHVKQGQVQKRQSC